MQFARELHMLEGSTAMRRCFWSAEMFSYRWRLWKWPKHTVNGRKQCLSAEQCCLLLCCHLLLLLKWSTCNQTSSRNKRKPECLHHWALDTSAFLGPPFDRYSSSRCIRPIRHIFLFLLLQTHQIQEVSSLADFHIPPPKGTNVTRCSNVAIDWCVIENYCWCYFADILPNEYFYTSF